MEEINCILCGRGEKDILCLKGRFKEKVRVVVCKNCSLVYTSPRMDLNELKKYYEEKYPKDYKREEDLEKINYKNEKRFNFLKENIKLKEKMDVFEIGCGKGYWLWYLKDKNFNVEGLEPNYEYYKYAKEKLQLNVTHDYVENFNFEKKYDLIVMFHVLEHLRNPISLLSTLGGPLKEEGILYIEVPNILRNPGYDFKENFFRAVHFYNFTYFTLEMLLKKCSLRVIKKDPGCNNLRILAKYDSKVNFSIPDKKEIMRQIKKVKKHIFFWNLIVFKNKLIYNLKKLKRLLRNE